MNEIIKVFKETIPALRFIGKQYDSFHPWGEWWENDWFGLLEKNMGGPEKILALWENGAGYAGLEKWKDGALLSYTIGMFCPADTPVPEGFVSVDFPASALGTCWLYGPEEGVHDTSACASALAAQGMHPRQDADGCTWAFENCLCPRYTTPDEKGNIILDYCSFVG